MERDVADRAGPREVLHLEARRADGRPDLRELVLEFAADHHLDEPVARQAADVQRAHRLAVAHDRRPVGDLEDLVEAVADVDDGDAGGLEFADDGEEFLDLLPGERGAGLVHHDDPRPLGEGLGDLDHLLLGDGQRADRRFGIDADADAVEEGQGVGVFAPPAAETRRRRLPAQEDVLAGRERRHEVELLVDDGDAGPAGVERRGDGRTDAVDPDRARVGRVGPRQDLDEGALAGAVLAQEGQDLAASQVQVRLLQGMDAGKRFLDPVHDQERFLGRPGDVHYGAFPASVGSLSASAFL